MCCAIAPSKCLILAITLTDFSPTGTAVVISAYQCHFCILESRREVEGSQLSTRIESVTEIFH